MQKRGNVELYIFLAFAVVAGFGLTYTILGGAPQGAWGTSLDCQPQCFKALGGAELQQCLADCAQGIPPELHDQQECYQCTCEKLTAENLDEAREVCQRACGTEATIDQSKTVPGLCQY
jgi:hypothetical protein